MVTLLMLMCWWDLHTLTPVVGPTAPHPTPHHSGFTHPNGSQHRHCACRIHGSQAPIWGKPLFLHPLRNFQPSQTTPYHSLHLSGVRSGGYVHCHNSAEELGGITVWAQRVPQTTRGAPALSASNSGRKGASRPYKHLHLLLVCW